MEEFNPAKAGCGLQGTASSPSSTTAPSLPCSQFAVSRQTTPSGRPITAVFVLADGGQLFGIRRANGSHMHTFGALATQR